MSDLRPENLPNYPATPAPKVPNTSRDDAFSKPGSFKSGTGKGWAPAKGTRFRSTIAKPVGRPRKKKRDPRDVTFY